MALDFGALPPEINSARMYTGPGSGPMLAAAAAWDRLASELGLVAAGYAAVISELTSALWIGAASASMVAAVAPYVRWLSVIAVRAEETASQAWAAVAAYEAAFTMTVPPPVIAANRVLLMTLIATNFLGQNTAAIAATEAHYSEMWAQDAAAMYEYAGSSATASRLTPFTSAPKTTNAAGLIEQAAMIGKTATTPAGSWGSMASSTTPQLVSTTAVPQVLHQLSSNASFLSGKSLKSFTQWLDSQVPTINASQRRALAHDLGLVRRSIAFGTNGASLGQQPNGGIPAGEVASGSEPFGGASTWAGLGGSRSVSAGAGQAGRIGLLSVPTSWATLPAEAHPASPPIGGIGINAAAKGGSWGLLRGLPLSSTGQRNGSPFYRYGSRQAVVPRPPSAG